MPLPVILVFLPTRAEAGVNAVILACVPASPQSSWVNETSPFALVLLPVNTLMQKICSPPPVTAVTFVMVLMKPAGNRGDRYRSRLMSCGLSLDREVDTCEGERSCAQREA